MIIDTHYLLLSGKDEIKKSSTILYVSILYLKKNKENIESRHFKDNNLEERQFYVDC